MAMTRSEINRRYYVTHLDAMRTRHRGRKITEAQRARRRELYRLREKRHTSNEIREVVLIELLRRDGFDCGICTKPLTGRLQIDHVVPGKNQLENLRLTHGACNQARNRKYADAA